MTLKWCPSCKRNVDTEHSWNIAILIILFILGVIPGLIYMALTWKGRCPICHIPDKLMFAPKLEEGTASEKIYGGGNP